MEKKSVSSRDLKAPYVRAPRQPARGTLTSSGTPEGNQTIPPAQLPEHGTEPAPSVTANASNLAAVADPQPSKARESNYFYSAELRAATNTAAFDIDEFLSDEPSIATSSELGRGASRKNALPNLADLSQPTDQVPAKKKKLKLPKVSFSKKSRASAFKESNVSKNSRFNFKLNLGGTNRSPDRPTQEAEGATLPHSARQNAQAWHSPRPLDLIETTQDRTYALTKRGLEKTFMASVEQEDITGSVALCEKVVDHDTAGVTLQSDSVSEDELDDLLAAMRAGDAPKQDPDLPEKLSQ